MRKGRATFACRFSQMLGGTNMREESQRLTLPRQLLYGVVAWVVLGGFLLFQLWPGVPKSTVQWISLLVVGPPLYLLGEALFGWLFSERHGEKLSPRRFSVLRIVVAFPIVLAAFAVSWWLSWLVTRS